MRFDEKTRALNAMTFAVMTVFSSGISMYAMALLLNLILGWDFNVCVWLSAIIVLLYISLGGLTSAIYNEVMQFFLIVAGFAPLVFLDCVMSAVGADCKSVWAKWPRRNISRPERFPIPGPN